MKKRVWISLVMAVLIAFSFTWSGRDQTPERDDLIRLHVIANSDSPEDQALKLRIRDQLLLTFGSAFQEAHSMSQAREVIRDNLDKMESIAQAEIQRSGCDYPVRAQLGMFPFPTKAYGDVVYPAGSYEALRVVIGKGTGANWWCVMFPAVWQKGPQRRQGNRKRRQRIPPWTARLSRSLPRTARFSRSPERLQGSRICPDGSRSPRRRLSIHLRRWNGGRVSGYGPRICFHKMNPCNTDRNRRRNLFFGGSCFLAGNSSIKLCLEGEETFNLYILFWLTENNTEAEKGRKI